MASKFFPLLVFRSDSTVTTSRLISFSDGGGEPSTHPFHPFLTAVRFFLACCACCCCWGGGGGGVAEAMLWRLLFSSSPSSGVCGRFDELADVVDEMDGPGVVGGEDGMGGGVTDTDRCIVAMWIVGRACQKDDVVGRGAAGAGAGRLCALAAGGGALDVEAAGTGLCGGFAGALARLASLSRSLSRSFSLSFCFSRRLRPRRTSSACSTSV